MDTDEGFLRGIPCVVPVEEHPVEEGLEARGERADDLLERAVVAARGGVGKVAESGLVRWQILGRRHSV